MKTTKKYLSLLIVLIFIFCAFSMISCDKKEQDDGLIRLIEVTHSIFYAPMYVAIENGYFEEENITIKLTNGGGADNCMTALLTNAQDIGLMGPEASIYVLNQGKKDHPIIFSQLTRTDGSFLMGRNEMKNFSWASLEGSEIIGGRKGGVPALTVEYVLKKNGLIDGENITINYDVEYDLIGPSFAAREGDYCTMFEPAATNMQLENKGYVLASVGKEAGEYPYTAFCASKSYINSNKSKIHGFIRALQKGMDFVQNNDAMTIAKAVEKQFVGTSLSTLMNSINAYKRINAFSTTPIMKEADFNRLQEIIIAGGIMDNMVPFSELVNNKIIEEALNV